MVRGTPAAERVNTTTQSLSPSRLAPSRQGSPHPMHRVLARGADRDSPAASADTVTARHRHAGRQKNRKPRHGGTPPTGTMTPITLPAPTRQRKTLTRLWIVLGVVEGLNLWKDEEPCPHQGGAPMGSGDVRSGWRWGALADPDRPRCCLLRADPSLATTRSVIENTIVVESTPTDSPRAVILTVGSHPREEQ